MDRDNPATLTVVTGPDGHDIGPAVAHLGRHLRDGLAIRTVVSTDRGPELPGSRNGAHCHASPGPTGAEDMALWVIPSAWQDPQTNLGVAYTGPPTRDLRFDLKNMDEARLNPASRVTVQYPARHLDPSRARDLARVLIPEPVEVGDLAVQARDAVLRGAAGGSRHVLVEAGDGQTFLDALHTVGIPPWLPYIDALRLWVVIDAAVVLNGAYTASAADTSGPARAATVALACAEEVRRQGGGTGRWGRMPAMRIAVTGFHHIVPAVAGVDSAAFAADPADGGTVTKTAADDVGAAVGAIEATAGARVDLIGTGPGTWIDLDPAYTP